MKLTGGTVNGQRIPGPFPRSQWPRGDEVTALAEGGGEHDAADRIGRSAAPGLDLRLAASSAAGGSCYGRSAATVRTSSWSRTSFSAVVQSP